MTLDSFFSTYDFHDSLISNINLNEDRIVITVDFCAWRQDDYVETEPETERVSLIFEDASDYDGVLGAIDDYSILDVDLNGNVVTFNLCDDLNDAYYQIRFRAGSARFDRGSFD